MTYERLEMKIRKLQWAQPYEDGWTANTPASHLGYVSIWYEDGMYWPCYEGAPPGGTKSLLESFDLCNDFHAAYIKKFLEE
jgi:hypothetical protein